jgi:hypothetical protein
MKKYFFSFIIFFTAIVLAGCSKQFLTAKYCLFRAEDLNFKGYMAQYKDISREKRLAIYRKSCDYFLKAYQADKKVFDRTRIYFATDSCTRVEDSKAITLFDSFEAEYMKTHPDEEVRYGEGPPGGLEG